MKKPTYQKLTKKFTSNSHGYDYSLIARKDNSAWYEARYINGSDIKGYVVASIFKRKANVFPNGDKLPDRECFPSPSDFGRLAWFYMPKSKEIAEERYKELVSKKGGE